MVISSSVGILLDEECEDKNLLGNFMKLIKCFLLLVITSSLIACSGSDIQVTAEFSNTQDIKEGANVYFDGKKIGKVSDVVKHQNGSIIELRLDKKTTELVDAKSAIVVNRIKSGSPLELYGRSKPSGNQLQDGQQIQGLDSMFQLGAWMVGDAIQIGTDSVSKYVGAFQEYLNGEEFEENKALVQEQLSGLTKSASNVLNDMEKEVNNALKDFSINEEEMAKTIEQLGNELSPLVNEVARNSAELVKQLEQFVVNMEEKGNFSEQQSGERILQSLVETFEKMNQSIEQGVEDGFGADKQ